MMFNPGDHVHHKPTGEDWVVQRSGTDDQGEFVEPAGWPPCRARASDCEMLLGGEGASAHWFQIKQNDGQADG